MKKLVLVILLSAAGCSRADQEASDGNICVSDAGVVAIPAGAYKVGGSHFYRDEGPVRTVELEAFNIDAMEVTNAQFRKFVDATGYVTRAERGLPEEEFKDLPDEMRAPGAAVFVRPLSDGGMNPASWWKFVEGASWRAPSGPGDSIDGKENYPVVQIALEDAEAYARWAGRRLPSEDEWEAAARSGLDASPYAWGDTPPDKLETPAANTWQGVFPVIDTKKDGYAGISPVGCYQPNAYGAYDMIGNVWEWTSDPYFPDRKTSTRATAPAEGYDPAQPGVAVGVLKGGSFLCAESYCVRYRPAARHAQDTMLGASHIGFRTAAGRAN